MKNNRYNYLRKSTDSLNNSSSEYSPARTRYSKDNIESGTPNRTNKRLSTIENENIAQKNAVTYVRNLIEKV